MAEQVDSEKVIFDLRQFSNCLYLELPESIADDVSKKVSAAVEVIRTQTEEIERLKSKDEKMCRDATWYMYETERLQRTIKELRERGVTRGELAFACRAWADSKDDRYLSNYIADFLHSKGLLIEDAPEKIYGVDVPKNLPEYSAMPVSPDANADPLKVACVPGLHPSHQLDMRRAINALADEVRRLRDELTGGR